MRKEKDQKS